MASGDVFSDLDNIPALSFVDNQPAAGVKVIITGWCSNFQASDQRLQLADAARDSHIQQSNAGNYGIPLKIFIDNTRWIRRRNDNGGSARNLAIWGLVL